MAQKSLGVGIIGTGFGLMHMLGYRACKNVNVVAVCQRTPGRADAFARLREGLDTSDVGLAIGNFLFAQLTRQFVHGVRTGQAISPSFLAGFRSQLDERSL